MPMQEDEFVNFKDFKAAMQDWEMAGAHKFNFRYKSRILHATLFVVMTTTPSASVPSILPLDSVLWWYL